MFGLALGKRPNLSAGACAGFFHMRPAAAAKSRGARAGPDTDCEHDLGGEGKLCLRSR